MPIKTSELILNDDGSVYHLHLKPETISKTIIMVGDPDRVHEITKYFDSVDITVKNREFYTQIGWYKNKQLTVISTGIGTDNIDIVLNELDALVNIDFKTRTVKKTLSKLTIIRIGTSGAIQKHIPVDSFLVSEYAVGLDGLLHFYNSKHVQEDAMLNAFIQQTQWSIENCKPYVVACNTDLFKLFFSEKTYSGITVTSSGFYGPQSRILRLPLKNNKQNSSFSKFLFQNKIITNLEMETAGIYGLSKMLGHRAISLNAIIANRTTGIFSRNPKKTINSIILYALEILVKNNIDENC